MEEDNKTWLVRAAVQGVAFALLVSVAGVYFGAKVTEAIAPPTCADTKDLVNVRPSGQTASSYRAPERDSQGRELTYVPERVLDGDTATGWAEGVDGLGQGETLSFQFDRPVTVTLLCIVNGYGQSWPLYTRNPRVRTLAITSSPAVASTPTRSEQPPRSSFSVPTPKTNPVETTHHELLTLVDAGTQDQVAVFQEAPVDFPGVRNLTLEIVSVYSGTTVGRLPDTSISEIEFWGPS